MPESVILPIGFPSSSGVLVASADRTASDTTAWIPLGGHFQFATFLIDVTAVTGTTPTLNVYIQNRLPDGVTADDIVSFTQRTSAAKERCYYEVGTGNTIGAATDGTLAAASTKTGALLGDWIRVKWVVAGTNPHFTFSLSASFR